MSILYHNGLNKFVLTASKILTVFLFLLSFSTIAQSITRAEYFFDTDPGPGNGAAIAITPTGGDVTFTTSIPTSALSQGFHQLAIRLKENGGRWSQFESRGFYITAATTAAANINAAEYFFDTDPGQGNASPIAVTAGATANFVVNVSTASLLPGFHFLAIRTKGSTGQWGLFEARGFYITASTIDVPNLSSAEYFYDLDPGTGNGTPIAIPVGATSNFTISLPSTGLQPGFHFLAIRAKGSNGKWGIFESRGFYVTGSTTDASNLSKAEYFFDTDPGNGKGISIPITAGANANFIATIPVAALSSGFHFLAIRTKGSDGKWGIFESRGFYVSPINATVGDIIAAEYFIDIDPGEENGTSLTVNPQGPTINQIFSIDLTAVASGPHKLGIRVKDADGIWSSVQIENFDVLVCTPPVAPTAPSVSRCNAGTVTLNATGAASGKVYRWYADAITTTVLFTGPAFTTPSLSTTTDYFVSLFDPASLCESARTTVSAIVTNNAKPLLNATGTIALCEGGSFLLSAPGGFSSYVWSNGAITQQILITANGAYSVAVGGGQCNSVSSDPTTFVFSTKPAKPIVQANGPTTLCDGGSVTLSAPPGFSYLWSSSATTQQITVSTTGNYSVKTTDAIGCISDASDPTVVLAYTRPAKPVIDIFGSTVLCGTNTVGLLAPPGFSIYQWSGGETLQGITVVGAGSHTVVVGNAANCLSPASSSVTVTSTNQPCVGGSINSPPIIDTQPLAAAIEGKVIADLTKIISDPDGNIDFSTLHIIGDVTTRGVTAIVNASFELTVDYSGMPFTGVDRITVEVCDLSGACIQQVIDIRVVGEVKIFNGLTPDGDGHNDFMFIQYVDVVEGASDNKATIFNRWGDLVWEADDYDNDQRVFTGLSSKGHELPSGTYFYKIQFSGGHRSLSGFITLIR